MVDLIVPLTLVYPYSPSQLFTIFTGLTLLLSVLTWLGLRLHQKWSQAATKQRLLRLHAIKQRQNKPDLDQADLSSIVPTEENWEKKAAIAYRPWQNGPYHVTMGIKNVNLTEWIEIDCTYLWKYRLKKRLYQRHRSEVLQVLSSCEAGQFEALYLLKDVLIKRYPTMFVGKGEHIIENLVTGDVWDLHQDAVTWERHNPLEVMGLLATEDFFLLQVDPATGVTTLKAAASCFPAGFKIEERVGRTLWEIHAGKVPQYETKLAKSMDRFFEKLRVDSPIQRFNYAIDDSDELFHRQSHHNLVVQRENPVTIDDLHLRVERQVLQRLPKTRDILFSIRTYVTPITTVTQDEAVARALRTSINSYTDDIARYKNKGLWDDVLQRHIRERLQDLA